jgi:uncharacterized protein (TIGR02594 family)
MISMVWRTLVAQVKPPWMDEATNMLGTKEKPDSLNNPTILNWAKEVGTEDYTADSIPWCALFVSWCMARNGIEPVKTPLWALNWAHFGTAAKPTYGAILVFSRTGGGHVGFYVGEDNTNYKVLGGNQGDAVSIEPVAKSRLVACRWPPGMSKFLPSK